MDSEPPHPYTPPPPPPPSSSSSTTTAPTPQVRSRITVVCAECKRLKLRCDRKSPCGSCTKRDTIARCIYSPAAAEKVDLHSLNNRLMQVETALAHLTSGQFTSTYPLSNVPSASSIDVRFSSAVAAPSQQLPHQSLAISLEEVKTIWLDRLNLSGGNRPSTSHDVHDQPSPSHPVVKMEESCAHISLDSPDRPISSSPLATLSSLSSAISPPISTSSSPSSPRSSSALEFRTQLKLPSINVYYSASEDTSDARESTAAQPRPAVTSDLLALLPPSASALSSSGSSYTSSSYTLQNLLHLAEQSTAHTHPFLNWNTFRSRAVKMIPSLSSASPKSHKRDREKERKDERAMEIFFGTGSSHVRPTPAFLTRPGPGEYDVIMRSAGGWEGTDEDLPFFATVCAALALGVSEFHARGEGTRDNATNDPSSSVFSRKGKFKKPSAPFGGNPYPQASHPGPSYWYALSVQALSVFEGSVKAPGPGCIAYTLDYIAACLLQVTFLLKGGAGAGLASYSADGDVDDRKHMVGGVGSIVFPLVGKMVNIARQMGLHHDPLDVDLDGQDVHGSTSTASADDGTSSSFTVFETEMRRRMWWSIFYYDLFISDAMGHPPLIPTNSYSTQLPAADVDEKLFSPDSTRIPPPKGVYEGSQCFSKDGFKHFELRCRLAQLVCSVKQRMQLSESIHSQSVRYGQGVSSSAHGPCYSIDQAASMEKEMHLWLATLPTCFQLHVSTSIPPSPEAEFDAALVAQTCEIYIIVNKLIMRVYTPFFRKIPVFLDSADPPPYQASHATVNAAHVVIHASKVLDAIWSRHTRKASLSPALLDLYPLGRTLLDASVICAHAAITQPDTMWASIACENVRSTLQMMKNGSFWRHLCGSEIEAPNGVARAEAIGIVEGLVTHLDGMGNYPSPGGSLKRKHDEVERRDLEVTTHCMDAGTQLSDGASMEVGTARSPIQFHSRMSHHVPPSPPSLPYTNGRHPTAGRTEKEMKKKKGNYPSVGIRIRSTKDGSSAVRDSASTRAPSPLLGAGHPTDKLPPNVSQSPAPGEPRSSDSALYISALPPSMVQDAVVYRARSSSITQDQASLLSSGESPHATHYTAAYASPIEHIASPEQQQRRFSTDQQQQSSPPTTTVYPMDPAVYDSYDNPYPPPSHQVPSDQDSYAAGRPYASSNGIISSASSPYTTTAASTPAYTPHSYAPQVSNHAVPSQSYYPDPDGYAPLYEGIQSETATGPGAHGQTITQHPDNIVTTRSSDATTMYDNVHVYEKPSSENIRQQTAAPLQPLYHAPDIPDRCHGQAWAPPSELESQYWQAPQEYPAYYHRTS